MIDQQNMTKISCPTTFFFGIPKSLHVSWYMWIQRYLCAINDNVEFFSSFRKICPKELELKVEHQEKHAIFLDLDITIEDDFFVYKLFDKKNKFQTLLFACLIYRVILHHKLLMVQFFQSFLEKLDAHLDHLTSFRV